MPGGKKNNLSRAKTVNQNNVAVTEIVTTTIIIRNAAVRSVHDPSAWETRSRSMGDFSSNPRYVGTEQVVSNTAVSLVIDSTRCADICDAIRDRARTRQMVLTSPVD